LAATIFNQGRLMRCHRNRTTVPFFHLDKTGMGGWPLRQF
jgi:hypothetical protein